MCILYICRKNDLKFVQNDETFLKVESSKNSYFFDKYSKSRLIFCRFYTSMHKFWREKMPQKRLKTPINACFEHFFNLVKF